MPTQPANVPAGSPKREKYPETVFLMPSERKYPYKRYKNGKWEVSCSDLADARRLALIHGETEIANKALELGKRYNCRWAK